jgi:hypothetical protein
MAAKKVAPKKGGAKKAPFPGAAKPFGSPDADGAKKGGKKAPNKKGASKASW